MARTEAEEVAAVAAVQARRKRVKRLWSVGNELTLSLSETDITTAELNPELRGEPLLCNITLVGTMYLSLRHESERWDSFGFRMLLEHAFDAAQAAALQLTAPDASGSCAPSSPGRRRGRRGRGRRARGRRGCGRP